MVDCNVEFAGPPSPTTTSVSQPSLLGSSIQQQTHFSSAVVLTSELIHTLLVEETSSSLLKNLYMFLLSG